MTKSHQRCGFLGCDPVSGQCLGFCEDFQRFSSKNMPVQFEGDEPEEKEAQEAILGMRGLSIAILASWLAVIALVTCIMIFWPS